MGIEHFLVMFPSAMLIARLSVTDYGTIISLSKILLFCGLGTICFIIITKKHYPFFLGPCFAYIGFIKYQSSLVGSPEDLVATRHIVFYGYLISALILLGLSVLYYRPEIKKIINTIFPNTVMGPAISLLGLSLASSGMTDSGLNGTDKIAKILALITITCIIVLSLVKVHFLQNASVLLGVFIGCVVATAFGVPEWPYNTISLIRPWHFYINGLRALPPLLYYKPPANIAVLALTILPATIIAFIEGMGRITIYEGMLRRDHEKYSETMPSEIMVKQSISNFISSTLGITPNTIYTENLAIMNLHNTEISTKHPKKPDSDKFIDCCYYPYSVYPYVIASCFCIAVALIPGLQDWLIAIPHPIFGGMELFVFGLISAPGIQILVEEQVNYKKISNQIITSSVFLSGVSGLRIERGTLVLEGMSLGLFVGVIVNLLTILLRIIGLINEKITLNQVLEIALKQWNELVIIAYNDNNEIVLEKQLLVGKWEKQLNEDNSSQVLKNVKTIKLQYETKFVKIIQNPEQEMSFKVKLPEDYYRGFYNDNEKLSLRELDDNWYEMVINEFCKVSQIKDLIRNSI